MLLSWTLIAKRSLNSRVALKCVQRAWKGLLPFRDLQSSRLSRQIRSGPFIRQSTSKKGALLNISVEIRPGKGRVLVQTTPLMGVIFQDAANTAVFVAENKTGKQLSSSDIIFSITAPDQIPGVDGPSAGALMTLLTISAIDNNTRLE